MANTCVLSFILISFFLASISTAKEEIGIYELKRGDFSLEITNYGAVLLSVILPDRNGILDDVVLGFDSLEDYKNDSSYFGALVGRVANRIGKAQFTLNGITYKLPANDGNNTLHGGLKGFGDVIWKVQSYKKDSHITMTYDSFDGEQGFPGDVTVMVTYMFIGTNKLVLRMRAKSLTKPTPLNLITHSYFNLGGHASGDIFSHDIQIFGSQITPVNKELIPTGEIIHVEGTPYDFLKPRTIGSRFKELPDGYDINYVLDDKGSEHLKKVAVVYNSVSGRKMELWSNQPGLQFYTSNMLKTTKGKNEVVYKQYAGFCLETQQFPDAVNHPNFPSVILNPGKSYDHVMVYRFTSH